MSGDEHPSTTASHWRDTNPPLFTKERLETSSGTSTSFDTATLLALFVFVGVVVLAHYRPGSARMHALSHSRPPQVFCAAQALWNPRLTFCAELNGPREPVKVKEDPPPPWPPASVSMTKPVARRRTVKTD